MMNKNIVSLMLLSMASSLLITGCEGMNSNFSCPMKPGVMCQSLDQVNDKVDQGKIGGPRASELVTETSAEKTDQNSKAMRVWIAPYEDRAGNHYEASFIEPAKSEGA